MMDRLIVNACKGVVPNWCFAEVGKLFFKIQKWSRFDKLFSEWYFYSQRGNIIRIKVTLQKKVNVVT